MDFTLMDDLPGLCAVSMFERQTFFRKYAQLQ